MTTACQNVEGLPVLAADRVFIFPEELNSHPQLFPSPPSSRCLSSRCYPFSQIDLREIPGVGYNRFTRGSVSIIKEKTRRRRRFCWLFDTSCCLEGKFIPRCFQASLGGSCERKPSVQKIFLFWRYLCEGRSAFYKEKGMRGLCQNTRIRRGIGDLVKLKIQKPTRPHAINDSEPWITFLLTCLCCRVRSLGAWETEGFPYLNCSICLNCIPKLLTELLKIMWLLKQIMTNTQIRAMVERGGCLRLRFEREKSVKGQRSKTTVRADIRNSHLLSNCFPFLTDKMNAFWKLPKISKRFSERCPWIV